MKKLSAFLFLGIFAATCAIAKEGDNATNDQALVQAAKEGRPDIVRGLIDRGADVNAKSKAGNPALWEAVLHKHADVAMLLIDKGADVNARSKFDGSTALTWAAGNGLVDVVQRLIEKGADVNAKADGGQTALMLASAQGHAKVAKILIERGAEINAKSEDGWTALRWASAGAHGDVATLLIDHGADVNAKNNDGKTARDQAETSKVRRSPNLGASIVFIAFVAMFAAAIRIRRALHKEWRPNYVRVAMGWLIPAAIGWAIYLLGLYFVPFFAFGSSRAGMITSGNRSLLVSLFGSSYISGQVYLVLSLAGLAISIIRHGDREWIPYLKTTAILQISALALAVGGGVLTYQLLR